MSIVELRNIVKRFPGVVANDGVSFTLKEGEIHALLGENGAGKTTLMNILYGLYQPDGGEIYVKDKKVFISSPQIAISLGIGMVHQHFTLVPSFSVIENIMLGLKDYSILNTKRITESIKNLSKNYGLEVAPHAKIWQLSVGEMQRVEIIKLLYRDVDILILDEPTAVLTPQEAESLFITLKKLKSANKSIIFISHKLNEVMEIADRITVLRKGKVVNTVNKADTSIKELARMMVGRNVILQVGKEKTDLSPKSRKTVLELKDVRCLNDKGLPALNGISFKIKEGEILGIAGVAGNGQRELAEVITGLREVIDGKIYFNGNDITNKGSKMFIKEGGSYIPADRLKFGVAPNLSIAENLILKKYYQSPISNGLSLNYREIRSFAREVVDRFSISATGIDMPAKQLSGGNLQRVIVARELEGDVRLIVAFNPTRGLDISAMEFVYIQLIETAKRGVAILLIAGDLEEIFTLSDRVAVLYEGRIMGYTPPEEKYLQKIGLMMAGVKDAEI